MTRSRSLAPSEKLSYTSCVPTCAKVPCREESGNNPLCSDHWDDLVEEATRILRGSAETYVGRTVNPASRREAHRDDWGCDHLDPIFRHHDAHTCDVVERALIRVLRKKFARVRNAAPDARGGRGAGPIYVYVAWRRKAN